jgi:type I restriction enzyme S subunit
MPSGPFGSSLLKQELNASGIPLLGIDNVHVEGFVDKCSRYVDYDKFQELKQYRVRPADIMITIMGTVGRCCVGPDDRPAHRPRRREVGRQGGRGSAATR